MFSKHATASRSECSSKKKEKSSFEKARIWGCNLLQPTPPKQVGQVVEMSIHGGTFRQQSVRSPLSNFPITLPLPTSRWEIAGDGLAWQVRLGFVDEEGGVVRPRGPRVAVSRGAVSRCRLAINSIVLGVFRARLRCFGKLFATKTSPNAFQTR